MREREEKERKAETESEKLGEDKFVKYTNYNRNIAYIPLCTTIKRVFIRTNVKCCNMYALYSFVEIGDREDKKKKAFFRTMIKQ